MDSNYYRYLNLPGEFFNRDEVVEKYAKTLTDTSKNKQWRIDGGNPDIFNETAYKWLKEFNCEIGVVELFYTAPHRSITWHIDVSATNNPIADYVKINFVWGTTESHYMQWGETNIPIDQHKIGINSVGSPHMLFTPNEITLAESLVIDKPALVRVGTPHRAVNDSDTGRWCLCMIPKHIRGGRLLWPQSLDLLKDYVI